MKREGEKVLFSLLIILFLSTITCASIEVGNLSDSIKTVYGQSEILSGWVNISILEEKADLLLTDSFDNKIKLNDILQMNKNANLLNYNCSIKNCSNDEYTATNSEKQKIFDLILGQEKIIAMRFVGTKIEILSANFSVESDAPISCTNQIEISVGDGSFKTQNYKADLTSCEGSKNYGCFDSLITSDSIKLDSNLYYCQNINLSAYPAFKIGAFITKVSGEDNVTMRLKSITGATEEIASCTIKSSELSTSGSEVGCQINYSITTPKNYYVCIKKTEGVGEIRLNGYYSGASKYCAYYEGAQTKKEISAYQIFAEGKMYGLMGRMDLENNLSSQNMANTIKNYIKTNYNTNLNCANGCIVPIKIKSMVNNQKVTIKNLSVAYKREENIPDPETNLYDISKVTPVLSTSGFTQIYLDGANFKVTKETGNKTLKIFLGDKELISKKITIQSIPTITYLFPDTTSTAYPTIFSVYANASSGIISSYFWEFSDGTNATTKVNNIEHSFNDTKIYTLKVTVTDSSLRTASKTFNIEVESPDKKIGEKYEEHRTNLFNINNQLKTYSPFLQKQISDALNLTSISEQLDIYFQKNKSADTLEAKNEILLGLLKIRTPKFIVISYDTQNITFFPDSTNINLAAIKEIAGGSYEETDSEKYKSALLSWQQENIELKLNYKEISVIYDQEPSHLLSYFELKTLQQADFPPYLFIKRIQNIKIDGEAPIRENIDYKYIQLNNKEDNFIFSTTDNFNFLTLPLFVSPSLDKLIISQDITNIWEGPFYGNINWLLFSLAVLFVLILGFIVYIILQEWYKSKYENYLFKGKNNMYNLINFIEAQKRQGISEQEIHHKLKEAGWNGEQITYVTNKYSGKRTGMIEIPIGGLLEKNSTPKPQEYPNRPVVPNKGNPYMNPQKKDLFKR